MANNYYQKHKERLRKESRKKRYQNLSEEEQDKRWKKAGGRYQNLSEEEKKEKHQYHRERNKILSKEQKQKQVEYMKNYYLTHKKKLFSRLIRFFLSLDN